MLRWLVGWRSKSKIKRVRKKKIKKSKIKRDRKKKIKKSKIKLC